MTKKDKSTIFNYLKSNKFSLMDCYKSASCYKWRVYNSIIEEMKKLNGYNFKIISYNQNIFTCGFTFDSASGSKFLKYYTPNKTTILLLEAA